MRYVIETIPHSEQRYSTCGDYWNDKDGTKHIVVSDMGNDDYALLVAVHELVEFYLTEKRGITEESITAFDIQYEDARYEGQVSGEPGDDPRAPYQNEHCIATAVERLVCAALGVKWADYEAAVEKLP